MARVLLDANGPAPEDGTPAPADRPAPSKRGAVAQLLEHRQCIGHCDRAFAQAQKCVIILHIPDPNDVVG
jgi:hypothetical protein